MQQFLRNLIVIKAKMSKKNKPIRTIEKQNGNELRRQAQ
jgi:hypothetical protein